MMTLTNYESQCLERIESNILRTSVYQSLKQFNQHGAVTTYEHSVHVAKCAFWLNRRLHIQANEEELVTACLLHDFFLYDWHRYGDYLHGYHHPKIAADLSKQFFSVSDRVVSAIESHMWPLTIFHIPSSRTAWVLTVADKICTVQETIQW